MDNVMTNDEACDVLMGLPIKQQRLNAIDNAVDRVRCAVNDGRFVSVSVNLNRSDGGSWEEIKFIFQRPYNR